MGWIEDISKQESIFSFRNELCFVSVLCSHVVRVAGSTSLQGSSAHVAGVSPWSTDTLNGKSCWECLCCCGWGRVPHHRGHVLFHPQLSHASSAGKKVALIEMMSCSERPSWATLHQVRMVTFPFLLLWVTGCRTCGARESHLNVFQTLRVLISQCSELPDRTGEARSFLQLENVNTIKITDWAL